MLFAVELPDQTAFLVPAACVDDAAAEAERRSGARPVYVYSFTGLRRWVMQPASPTV